MENAPNPQAFRDLDEHGGIFDIDYLTGWHLGDIQRQPEHVSVGLADVHKAGGNEGIHRSLDRIIAATEFEHPPAELPHRRNGGSPEP